MSETDFKQALAAFATAPAEDLAMTDELDEIGVDSLGVLELLLRLEDSVGVEATSIDADLSTVQDLFDHVQRAAARHNA